jgi:hypothetical protein
LESVIKMCIERWQLKYLRKRRSCIETLKNERLNVCFVVSCQSVNFAICWSLLGEGAFWGSGPGAGTCHYSEISSGDFTWIWPQKLQPNCVSLYGANPFLTDFNNLWRCSLCVCVCVWVCGVCVCVGGWAGVCVVCVCVCVCEWTCVYVFVGVCEWVCVGVWVCLRCVWVCVFVACVWCECVCVGVWCVYECACVCAWVCARECVCVMCVCLRVYKAFFYLCNLVWCDPLWKKGSPSIGGVLIQVWFRFHLFQ